jgi:anti-anti-sigma regulatory factor
MINKKKDLSIDIYHRIYRLVVKRATPEQIAYTLNLPVPIVRNVVRHFNGYSKKAKEIKKEHPIQFEIDDQKSYLDIYILSRLKFSILDLNGMIVENHCTVLQIEFDKILKSDLKAVALLMSNVKDIDETGLATILSFHKVYLKKGRYTAILDPAPKIEEFFIQKEIEQNIDIYGTEKAFEDKALKTMKQK